jgi:hypothetical protein
MVQILSQISPASCDEFRWKYIHEVLNINLYLSELFLGRYIRLFLCGWWDNPEQTRTQIIWSRLPDVAWSDSPARTIPVDVVLPRMIQQCLFDGGTWGLALDDLFANPPLCMHQISRSTSAMDKLPNECSPGLLFQSSTRSGKKFGLPWETLTQSEKDVESIADLMTTDICACLKVSRKTSRIVLPWMRQKY